VPVRGTVSYEPEGVLDAEFCRSRSARSLSQGFVHHDPTGFTVTLGLDPFRRLDNRDGTPTGSLIATEYVNAIPFQSNYEPDRRSVVPINCPTPATSDSLRDREPASLIAPELARTDRWCLGPGVRQ
jgi:hypothetical protein